MLYLVTGGSGSGKSCFAEKLAVDRHRKLFSQGGLYYIATMLPYDEECLKRIDRHREMRREKGFATIECYSALDKVEAGKKDVLLLECMSNLLANEMYQEDGGIKKRGDAAMQDVAEAILKPVLRLEEKAGCVIVVTNEVFSDGVTYDQETECYIRLLGKINRYLAACAGSVTEVICSIPVFRKGEAICCKP